jgi:hypothetical protein
MVTGPLDAAWERLCAALGVPYDLAAGDRFAVDAEGAPPLTGTVSSRPAPGASVQCFLLLDDPAPGTAFVTVEGTGDQVAASLYLYLYGPGAAAAAEEAGRWRAFLAERLGAAVP